MTKVVSFGAFCRVSISCFNSPMLAVGIVRMPTLSLSHFFSISIHFILLLEESGKYQFKGATLPVKSISSDHPH